MFVVDIALPFLLYWSTKQQTFTTSYKKQNNVLSAGINEGSGYLDKTIQPIIVGRSLQSCDVATDMTHVLCFT